MRSFPLSRRALLPLVAVGSLLLSAAAPPAVAAAPEGLRIGVEGAYPPFNQADKKGRLSGFDIDIANALCKVLQTSCSFVRQRWDRMIPDLVDGKYDLVVSSMSITAERQQRIDFTSPYYVTPANFVAKKGTSLAASLDALKGQRIGVQKATTHERYLARTLSKSVAIVRYDTLPKAQADMVAGNIDLVFADAIALSEGFLKKDKGKGFVFVGPDLHIGSGIGIGVRKGQPELLASLNRALAAIRSDGTYDQISGKYFDFPLGNWQQASAQ
jgi:arginine/ornithine transport system substrate-binding protein